MQIKTYKEPILGTHFLYPYSHHKRNSPLKLVVQVLDIQHDDIRHNDIKHNTNICIKDS